MPAAPPCTGGHKLKYNPALDGIRALAVAMVVGFHACVPGDSGGYLGVDVFFVLSGFLITSLLLEEVRATGTIDLRGFYWRRLLRLTPALASMLLVYLVVAPFVWPKVPFWVDLRDVLISLFYLADYASAIWSVPLRLRQTWSLSVEEHFYLVWPLLILCLTRLSSRRRMAIALGCMYLLFSGWRIYCDLHGATGYEDSYYRFDTRLSGLTVGGLLAVVLSSNRVLHKKRADLLAFVALSVIALCSWHYRVESTAALTVGMAAVEFATLAMIYIAVNSRGSLLYRLLSLPAMSYVGRMSYGIYLWHYPIFVYMWDKWPWYEIVVIGGLASFALAVLSYHSVESIARSYRRRNARTLQPAPAGS